MPDTDVRAAATACSRAGSPNHHSRHRRPGAPRYARSRTAESSATEKAPLVADRRTGRRRGDPHLPELARRGRLAQALVRGEHHRVVRVPELGRPDDDRVVRRAGGEPRRPMGGAGCSGHRCRLRCVRDRGRSADPRRRHVVRRDHLLARCDRGGSGDGRRTPDRAVARELADVAGRPAGGPWSLPAASCCWCTSFVQHPDGLAFLDVTRLAVVEPFVTVAIAWLALAATAPVARIWLTAAAATYAVISIDRGGPRSDRGGLAACLPDRVARHGLIAAGVLSRGWRLRSLP